MTIKFNENPNPNGFGFLLCADRFEKLNAARMSVDGDGSTEPNLDSRKMYLKSRSSVIPFFYGRFFRFLGKGTGILRKVSCGIFPGVL